MEVSRGKLVVTGSLIIALGAVITSFSIYHAVHLGKSYPQYPLFLYGTALLGIAVGGYSVFLLQNKISEHHLNKLLSMLPADERKVIACLMDRKEIEQNRLATLTGLSNVKISRILHTLSARGIIEKKKQGYTNLIISKV